MDDADLTQARMEAEEALRARGKPSAVPKVRYSHCLDCGEPIPEARQAHGFSTCVDCAELAERKAQRRRS
jgi:RNA polymerase-binding transcription factor DksA